MSWLCNPNIINCHILGLLYLNQSLDGSVSLLCSFNIIVKGFKAHDQLFILSCQQKPLNSRKNRLFSGGVFKVLT
jgi:hypothetical protein